jgi:hypothetical protein
MSHAKTQAPPLLRPPHKCWHIYHGDVHVGTIAERVGNPHDTDQWEWNCGFYPGSEPGEYQSDTAATFAEARADFERTWQVFCRNAPRPIFRRGAIREIGPRENMRCGMLASGLSHPAMDPASRAVVL